MRIFLAPFLSAILLAQLLCAPSALAQGDVRPRRSQTAVEPSPSSLPPKDGQWQTRPTPLVTSAENLTVLDSKNEPIIRVALATEARSASISTTSHLMNATDVVNTMVALDVARIRLEPRLLSPLPLTTEEAFRLSLAALTTRADAELKAREVKAATNEDSQVTLDNATKTWGLLIGDHYSQSEAEELRARLLDAAIETTIVPLSPPASTVAKSRGASTTTTSASAPAPSWSSCGRKASCSSSSTPERAPRVGGRSPRPSPKRSSRCGGS